MHLDKIIEAVISGDSVILSRITASGQYVIVFQFHLYRVSLDFYKNLEVKEFKSFNEALDYYFTHEYKEIKKEKSAYEKKLEKLERIIHEQKMMIEGMKKSEKENREKAELIYNNYQLIKEVLEEIKKANKKYSWKEIKEKLKGHKIIKELDVKEKKVVVEVK